MSTTSRYMSTSLHPTILNSHLKVSIETMRLLIFKFQVTFIPLLTTGLFLP